MKRGHAHILVIDDDPAVLAGLTEILAAENYAVITAPDGESGLQRLLDPRQMGNLFKALALTSPGLPVPAGFAEGV